MAITAEYSVTAYCVEPGCRCLDRAGVILYRGDSAAEAEAAGATAPAGYSVETTTTRPVDGGE
jgi:hypothetical protein